MKNNKLDRAVVGALIVLIIILAFITIKEIIVPLFMAFILGYAFRPAYLSLKSKIKFEKLSAIIVILTLVILVLVPVVFLVPSLFKQTFNIYTKIQDVQLGTAINNLFPSKLPSEMVQAINLQFSNILSKLFGSILASFSTFLSDFPMKLLSMIIFLFGFYFVLIDFERIESNLAEILPLSKESRKKFSSEFRNITDGILYGQILVGILQGVLVGLMFFILGVDGILFFTIVAMIAGALPIIGPSVAWIPVCLLLLIGGESLKALVLVIYGNMVTWFTDGMLRPFILSRRSSLPISLSFISTLGGLFAFGLVGLVLGPLIMSYLVIIIQFYKQGRFEELFKS